MLIIDTSGRLHIDQALMEELARIKERVRPHDVLFVVDAMIGQDAVKIAEQFAEVAEFDGVVLSKLDGDARGGAALSVKAVTGKPMKFASTGEKLGDFERSTPTGWRSGSSGWATSCRSSRRPRRRSRRRRHESWNGSCEEPVHARGLPRPAQADPQDGAADQILGMFPAPATSVEASGR